MVTFCSIVRPGTEAQARVLGESVLRHHPDARLLAAAAPATQVPADPAPFAEYVDLGADPSIPSVLAEALARGADLAVYLAPTVRLYETLEPVTAAATGDGVALVPRLGSLPEDGEEPSYAELLAAGRLSPAMVAVSRGEAAEAFLGWWLRRREESELADGRWLELASDELHSISVVTDPGCNVSFWNLHERPLVRAGKQVSAAGRPLRFVDFDGFDPERPYWLSDAGTRVHVIDDPVLSELCGAYAEQVREAGWTPPPRRIADVERLGNGQKVDGHVRALWERARTDRRYFGDPLSGEAADAFVAWMREAPGPGAAAGVSRYLLAVYHTRPDLEQAFPDLDGLGGPKLVEWGRGSGEVLSELVEPLGPGGDRHEDGQIGVNVIGYLGETLGLAEAARLYIRALDAAGVSVSTTAVTPDLPVKRGKKPIERTGSSEYRDRRSPVPPSFNLACLNGDHLADLTRRRGQGILQGLPTIGQWGWETDVLPPSWEDAFGLVEEVWVYSTFMAENLGRLLPMPVVVVPPAIVTPEPSGAELRLARDDRTTFLFMLDFFSTLERKNPLGLVEAFKQAFAPDEGPRLIVKTINARFRPEAADALRTLVGDRPDVELVDLYLDPGEKAALLARADCFVSLHRSEGFGLPLAESMSLGTPVITTGYSGNLDFTTDRNSYLVDWSPTRVGPAAEVYPPEGTWAEPDLDHAAELMRHVWQHPDEAAAKGRRAQSDIQRLYAPAIVGAIARARLERLRDGLSVRRGGRASVGGADLDTIDQALSSDVRVGVGPVPKGPAGFVRRAVLRLILPFSFHEREIDRALAGSVRRLSAELEREREHSRHDRRRLHQLEAAIGREEEPPRGANGRAEPRSRQAASPPPSPS